MISRPTPHVLACMRLLKNTSPEFNAVLAWFRQEREEAVKTLSVSRDQWSAAQYQGAVQTLDAIEDYVQKSLK